MSVPASRLPQSKATPRQQGLIEPLRLTTGVTRGELATILREAAIDAEKLVLRSGLRADALRTIVAGISTLSDTLWTDIHRLVQEGIRGAAELAADQQLARELAMGMPEGVVRQLAPNMTFNALQSANDVISRHTNGFTLSQRVYRNSQATVLQVGKIVDRGLALQLSARELATQVKGFISPSTPGGASYAAMRLARTEINNAHHETTIRASKDRPWVTGYRWMLSGSHPRADICDTYAQEGDGSGEGRFSKSNVPGKPHPQCLCFVVVEQEVREQFLKNLQNGGYDRYVSGDVDPRTFFRETGRETVSPIKTGKIPKEPASAVDAVEAKLRTQLEDVGIKDEARVSQIVKVSKALQDKYGISFGSVEKVKGNKASNVLAYMRNTSLGVNPRLLKDVAIKRDMKNRWQAQGTGTITDVIVHEYGHMILEKSYVTGRQRALQSADSAARKALRQDFIYKAKRESLGEYAASDSHEALAELFMHYHMGGEAREQWVIDWGEALHKGFGKDPTPLREVLGFD